MEHWENWELDQRRHALNSLIETYAEIQPGGIKHRRYMRELRHVCEEIQRRHDIVQMNLFSRPLHYGRVDESTGMKSEDVPSR